MSNPFLDYIPCDLTCYSQEILPLWRLAQEGETQPLQKLIRTASQLSFWPIFTLPNPLPDAYFAGPLDFFGYRYFRYNGPTFWTNFLSSKGLSPAVRNDLLKQIAQENLLDFWLLCLRNLSTFIEMQTSTYTQPGAFLHNCLFYTFCCQLPAETLEDSRLLGGDDSLFLWEEYLSRDAETQMLWSLFHQPAPQPLADHLLFPQRYQDYLATPSFYEYAERPRDFFSHLDSCQKHEGLTTSFLTTEECRHVLKQLHTHAKPEMQIIISCCVSDGRWKKEWSLPSELIQHIQMDMIGEQSEAENEIAEYLHVLDYWASKGILTPAITQRIYDYWKQEYPEEMSQFAEYYYQWLWEKEAKIVQRFHYAISHGWGILKLYHR